MRRSSSGMFSPRDSITYRRIRDFGAAFFAGLLCRFFVMDFFFGRAIVFLRGFARFFGAGMTLV